MLGDKPRNHLCRLLSEFAEIHSNLTQVIRAKEFRPVEVDHVFWRLGNPNLGFPSDITGVFAERLRIEKCRHINPLGPAALEHGLNLMVAFGGHWPMRGDGLDRKEPVALGPVENDVGQFVVLGDRNIELG
jgi:hypothetical protein